jgi:hypothetical protein
MRRRAASVWEVTGFAYARPLFTRKCLSAEGWRECEKGLILLVRHSE